MEPSSSSISCGSTQTWVPINAQEAVDLKVQVRSHVQSYVGHLRELKQLEAKKVQLEAREVQLRVQKKQIHAEVLVAKREALAAKQDLDQEKVKLQNAINLMTARLFYGVFQKKDLDKMTSEQANSIVSTYGLNEAIVLDRQTQTSKVTSMLPFIQFIKDNRAPLCNFQKISQVTDVKTFAQYIQDPSSFVRVVAMKKGITDEEKQSLTDANVKRNETLKVQYV
ncbi:hypothetical protein [Candidatus Protochlamydia sp. R18]|uniref:hypothetical protein n=1 Tax=Candidatus Protochlamydia sp. R18 TaxID=1353977 RepID=UPI0005A6AF2B|nr:hypothetical protein [Candidatus Protochlamydia sp. R18]